MYSGNAALILAASIGGRSLRKNTKPPSEGGWAETKLLAVPGSMLEARFCSNRKLIRESRLVSDRLITENGGTSRTLTFSAAAISVKLFFSVRPLVRFV